jgi:hypothetical protein
MSLGQIAKMITQVRNGPAKPRKARKSVINITAARKGKRNRSPSMAGDGPVRELACSVTDPWSCSACIPDGSTNTGCFSIKQMFTLGTGAAGTAASLFIHPDVDNFSYQDTGSTATTTTVTGNWVAAASFTAITSQYQMTRPVSAGIRVEYVGNTQTDQGVIVVGLSSSGQGISNYNTATLGLFTQKLLSYKTFPLRAGAQITWRPEDWQDMEEFQLCGSAVDPVTGGNDRPVMCVAIFGANAATSSLVQCEVVANFEGQFKMQTFIPGGISGQLKSTVPAVPGWYEKAKNIFNLVEPYIPLVLSLLGGNGNVASLAMGNGMKYAITSGKSSRRNI